METTWLQIGDITVRAPVTAATNLLVSVQCMAYAVGLASSTSRRSRLWAGFFALMSAAMLAAALKHGLRHSMTNEALVAVLAVSNLAGAGATYFAQRATLVGAARSADFTRVARVGLATFALANAALGPQLWLLIAHTAVGLPPVIASEAARRARLPGVDWVAAGLSTSVLTGAIYLSGVSFGRWFTHIDLAHVVMGASFLMIHRGVRRGMRGGSSNPRGGLDGR